ncbi:SPATA5 [Branchiostoma lanceolatum]|uniref:SPATA5 protein n=1 Tax=Branchiostoma lanceolatum TaxID=7740 RepID=A0A8K0EVB7_BRALA|nr:SPATA5 [Branchiostoma lanceolatum]
MSKKGRGTKSDWVKCSPSGCLVSRADLVRREVPVSPGDQTDFDPRGRGAGVGYVGEDGCLRAVACSVKVDVEESKLTQSTKQELVRLSPTTMKLCLLCVGRPVLVSCMKTGRAAVGMAWPVATSPLTTAGLGRMVQMNCGAEDGAIVLVQPLLGPFLPLAELYLVPRKYMDFQKTRHFQDYCRQQLDLKILIPGNSIQLMYYGKPCVLTVCRSCGVDGKTQTIRCLEENTATKFSAVEEKTLGNKENTMLADDMAKLMLEDGTKQQNAKSEVTMAENNTKSMYHQDPLIQNLEVTFEESLCEEVNIKESSVKNEDDTAGQDTKGRKEKRIQRKEYGPFYYVTSGTKLIIDAGSDRGTKDDGKDQMTYDMIGGLSRELSIIRDMVELPLTSPEAFRNLGVAPPHGVLLFGPPGTGKTMVAKTLAAEIGATFTTINGPEVLSKFYGETESRLRDIFKQAEERTPSIIFIDELDALCPKRENVQSEMEKRVVATLLTLMDGIRPSSVPGQVVVLGATNRPDAVDPALRRPGRFDREVELPIPNAVQRAEILSCLLRKMPHDLSQDNIARIADSAHGYVGADLTAVCKEAGLHAFRRYTKRRTSDQHTQTSGSDGSLAQTVQVSMEDFVLALKEVKPSAMREVMIDVPKVRWSDIGGQAVIKQKLQQAVEWPLQNPEAFRRMGIRPPQGILMYGPPGCSKTLIARALATESGLNFIAVKGPELFSKWVGESELAVREVFRKARAASPSIVFFDEIDALAVSRGSSGGGNNVADRVLAQLLTEIDGVDKLGDVTVVAATNRPDMIDKALLRPGRIDRILYIPLPDANTRRDILKIQFQNMPVSQDLDVDWLVENTKNYSGAEVVAVCQEAALSALTEDIKAQCVQGRHFEQALQAVCPRIGPELIQFYQQYQKNSGLHCI